MFELHFDSILDIDPYLACPNPRCMNKKLKPVLNDGNYKMHCEGCNASMPAGRTNKYAVATFCANRGTERLELAMFLPEILKRSVKPMAENWPLILTKTSSCLTLFQHYQLLHHAKSEENPY